MEGTHVSGKVMQYCGEDNCLLMFLDYLVHCWGIALTKFAVWQKLFGFLVHRNMTFSLHVWQLCEVLVVCLSAISTEDKLCLVKLSLISEFRKMLIG